jgi:trigger factor
MTAILIKKTHEEPGAASLAVTVSAQHVQEVEGKLAAAYAQKAKLPGFRRGKAPAAVVRKHFAEDIRQSLIEDLVRESWRAALEQETLRPIADPHIHNVEFKDGADLTFEFHVEVKPELSLQRLGGFKLKRTVSTVTDAMVEAQLNAVREQRAPWAPLEGTKPAPKDLVDITVSNLENGEAQDPQKFQIVLGDGQAIPELEERIMGLLPGGTLDTTVKFPDDFPDEAKRGQTRSVRVTLGEVKRQQLPDLTDDFAREVGDFESLDALRTAIRQDLEREAVREADAQVRGQLIQQIVEANRIQAPRPMVDRATALYAQAYSVPEAQWERFREEFRPVAEAQVRRDLVIDYVAERDKLAATEADVDARIAELAAKRTLDPKQLKESLHKAKRLRELQRSLTEEGVFRHLLSQSTVEDT